MSSHRPHRGWLRSLWLWVINDETLVRHLSTAERNQIDLLRLLPFALLHGACLFVLVVGVSPVAVAVAIALYAVRMFAITGFYHRYFSHRSFKVPRGTQFLMALAGCTAGQRGPLWWAGHHREHHAESDTAADPHSPKHHGFLFSHTLWFLTRGNFPLRRNRVRDWLRFPELVWLERLDWVPFLALGVACYALGAWLEATAPSLRTSGPQMLIWGFFVSTVTLYHATYTINSVAHRFGRRRYETGDTSRNNAWLALITLGEGWHNNHHHYPLAARQGFFWWELDICYLGLRLMETVGLASDLRPVPASILASASRGARKYA